MRAIEMANMLEPKYKELLAYKRDIEAAKGLLKVASIDTKAKKKLKAMCQEYSKFIQLIQADIYNIIGQS